MAHQPPQDVIDAAQAAEAKWGVPASITLAQWALESAWGAHMPPGSNNPFGIKARKGDNWVSALTKEFVAGKWVRVGQGFRRYASIAEAFDDHGRLLATSAAYAKARASKDDDAYADALTGVYATDPTYGSLLHAIMRGSNLYQYDRPKP